MPPKSDIPQQMETEGDPDVEITSKFSDEFDIDALLKEVVENPPEAMEDMSNDAYIPVEAEGRVKSVNDAILEQETVIEVKGPFVKAPPAPKFSKRVKAEAAKSMEVDGAEDNGEANENSDEDFDDADDDEYSDADEDGEVQFKKVEFSEKQMLTYNKNMKLHLKRLKKKKIKTARLDSDLAQKMKGAMDIDMKDVGNQMPQKYSFREHFGISN